MTQKDVKKRDVLSYDKFIEAYNTVLKPVMTKAGENPDPGAHDIKGEGLYSRNDANPYKAFGIPHDEKTADINNSVSAKQVDVDNVQHDGKDQNSKNDPIIDGPNKETKAEEKNVEKALDITSEFTDKNKKK